MGKTKKRPTTYDVRCARVRHHADLAATAFSRHVVECRLDRGLYRHWRCHRPDDCAYWFDVTTVPGRITVAGDVGTLVLERTTDMVAWCRGSIHSIDYFAEKVVREIETAEYDPEIASAWAAEVLAEEGRELLPDQRDLLVEIRDRIEDELYEAEIFRRLCEENIWADDLPNLRNFTSSFLWCRECLIFLIGRLDDGAVVDPDCGVVI